MEENIENKLAEEFIDSIELDDTKLKIGYQGELEQVGKLAKALSNVLENVGDVNKSGHNDYYNYDYATESDVLEEIRPKLAEENVFCFQTVENYKRKEKGKNITTIVSILFTFVHEDGGMFTVRYYGEGQDKGDKSFYKAFTGCVKYAIMKNFLVSTGDDPENDSPGRSRGSKGSKSSRSGSSKKGKKGPSKKQLVASIKKMYKKNEDDVTDVAFSYLEDKGKDKDMSLVKELNTSTLKKMYKECKSKLEE